MTFPRTLVTSGPWRQAKWEERSAHLTRLGIPHELFIGLDHEQMKVRTEDTYTLSGDKNDRMGVKSTVTCLRYYIMWKAMLYMPEDAFITMDDDSEFCEDWKTQYDSALEVLPEDWDIVVLGSCCAGGKPTNHIGNNLYEVKYPLCLHTMMVRKKALPVLLESHQKLWAPLDIAMCFDSFPKLKVYTILPRITIQKNMALVS